MTGKTKRFPVRRLARAFRAEVLAERSRFGLSYALAAGAVVATAVQPWPVKFLIDSVLTSSDTSTQGLSAGIASLEPATAVVLLVLAYLAATIAYVACGTTQRLLDARIRERLALGVREKMLVHLERLPPTLAGEHRSGEIVARLTTDTDYFVRMLTKALPQIFRHTATVVVVLGVMFWVAPWLGLVGLALVPALGLVARRYAGRLADASRRKRAREGDVAGVAQEMIRGLPALQASGKTTLAREKLLGTSRDALEAGIAETRVTLSMERALQLGQGVAVTLVCGAGAFGVLRGALTVGELTVLLAYVTQLLKPVEKVNELAGALSKGLASGERLLALLERPISVREADRPVGIERAQGRFELHHVAFSYPGSGEDAAPVLEDISVSLRPGEITVITGASGAGKSTLLALLARLYDPTSGHITLDGTSLRALALSSLRAQIGFVTQRGHLFMSTIREILCEARQTHAEADLWRVLEEVALADFVRTLPDGLDTPIGEDGVNVSGGQRRRLLLAHALLLDRPILLLDEPTAGVDAASEQVIRDVLVREKSSRTIVVVTHRERLLAAADQAFRLENGRLISIDRPAARGVAA